MNSFLDFQGKCPFWVYTAWKPDKYVIKIITMCNARTLYMTDIIQYLGKEWQRITESLPTSYVKTLSEIVHEIYRNITCNNWFKSIPLTNEMINDHGLTLDRTNHKNKSEIPLNFQTKRKLSYCLNLLSLVKQQFPLLQRRINQLF